MGLDMYLTTRCYLGGTKDERTTTITNLCDPPFPVQGLRTVEFEVAYWRKANAIHKWFVDKVQDGNDDCGDYYVSMEELKKLLGMCKLALTAKNPEEYLPTQGGFFFGGTEYDDYYKADLEYTIRKLEPLVTQEYWPGFDFYYHASW